MLTAFTKVDHSLLHFFAQNSCLGLGGIMQLIRSWRLMPFILVGFTTSLAHAEPTEPAVTGKGIVGGALLGGEAVMLTEAALKVRPGWAYYIGGGAGLIGGGIGGYYLEDHLTSKEAMYMLSAGMLLAIPTAVAALNAASYDTPLEYTQDAPAADEGADEGLSAVAPTPLPTMPAANTTPAVPPTTGSTPASGPATGTPAPATTTPAPSPAPATTPSPATPSSSQDAKPQGTREVRRNRALAHRHAAPVVIPPALLDFSGTQLALGLPAFEVRGTYTRREMAMYGVKQQTEVRIPVFQMMF
jgi:hypothetical protein